MQVFWRAGVHIFKYSDIQLFRMATSLEGEGARSQGIWEAED